MSRVLRGVIVERSHSSLGLEAILVGYGQFFASTAAAGSQNTTSIGGGHSLAKTMFVAALALRGLESPFHAVYTIRLMLKMKKQFLNGVQR